MFYYIAHKDILSTSLMFMGDNSFLSSKILPLEFLFSISSKICHINYASNMKIKHLSSCHLRDHYSVY